MTSQPSEERNENSGNKESIPFDVFISHASEDTELARSLSGALSNRGLKCWFDKERLTPWEGWDARLKEAIDHSRGCLVVLSKASVPSKPWISREWALIQSSAWKRTDLELVPLLVDRVEMPTFLRRWHALRWDRRNTSLDRLAADIVARLSSDQPSQEKKPDRDSAEALERFRKITEALKRADSSDQLDNEETPNE